MFEKEFYERPMRAWKERDRAEWLAHAEWAKGCIGDSVMGSPEMPIIEEAARAAAVALDAGDELAYVKAADRVFVHTEFTQMVRQTMLVELCHEQIIARVRALTPPVPFRAEWACLPDYFARKEREAAEAAARKGAKV